MNSTTDTPDRLEKIEGRLVIVEEMLHKAIASSRNQAERETAVEPWRFLVRRQHPWRKQLYLQGRNLTARQLVGAIKANHLDDEKAAANYHLPLEAIREAVAYVEQNSELLATEAEIEGLMSKREEIAHVPQPVS